MNRPLLSPLQQRLAQRLVCARLHRGWSQRKLGVKMGLSAKTGSVRINRYEHGRSALSLEALEVLVRVLDMPWEFFFAEDDRAKEICPMGADG